MNTVELDQLVKKISKEIYKYADIHNKRLAPTMYKALFQKIAERNGVTGDILDMIDVNIFIEDESRKIELEKERNLSKLHSDISKKVDDLVMQTGLYSKIIRDADSIERIKNSTSNYLSLLNISKQDLLDDKKSLEHITDMIFKDSLTGLLNRRFMNIFLKKEFARQKRYGSVLSIMMLDIDKFKAVNDTYGHFVGDKVLHSISELLKNSIRTSDMAVRYGGEEMVLICPLTNLEGAKMLAEKLRYMISKLRFQVKSGIFSVTGSFGVTECRQKDDKDGLPIEALHRMDDALYQSKNNGRNIVTAL